MKIKQSFIERCGEITIKQLDEIQKQSNKSYYRIIYAMLNPLDYDYDTELWKATANVLKIDLSDIYEVEQLPNTLTEKL